MKNIEKIYGIQINIREQIDAEHLSFYKEILERVMRFVNFEIDNYCYVNRVMTDKVFSVLYEHLYFETAS